MVFEADVLVDLVAQGVLAFENYVVRLFVSHVKENNVM
jgi:hypothetical protein